MKRKIILLGFIISAVCLLWTHSAFAQRYIVGLNRDNDAVQLYAARSYDLEPVAESIGAYVTEDEELARYLVESGMADYMEEDCIIELFDAPEDAELFSIVYNDTYFNSQWNLSMVKALEARGITAGSSDITVAVIDSGLYSGHPDFDPTHIKLGRNFVSGTDPTDFNDIVGHGTAGAGIINAVANNGAGIVGIADGVNIMPIRFMNSIQNGSLSALVSGIEYAIDNGCKVINLSLGTTKETQTLHNIIQRAYDENIIVVAAVGNSSSTVLNYPAAYDTVVGVGAVTSTGSHASYSQRNSSVWISAPGTRVPTTMISGNAAIPVYPITSDISSSHPDYPIYKTVSGTSFACPHIAALAALAASIDPDITPDEFMEHLKTTAVDQGTAGRDDFFGYGLVDMQAVLQAVVRNLPGNTYKVTGTVDANVQSVILTDTTTGVQYESYILENAPTTASFPMVPAGTYTVSVIYKEGYGSASLDNETITVSAQNTENLFTATSEIKKYTIHGTIDDQSHILTIKLIDQLDNRQKYIGTMKDNILTFQNVPMGSYRIDIIYSPGYKAGAASPASVIVNPNGSLTPELAITTQAILYTVTAAIDEFVDTVKLISESGTEYGCSIAGTAVTFMVPIGTYTVAATYQNGYEEAAIDNKQITVSQNMNNAFTITSKEIPVFSVTLTQGQPIGIRANKSNDGGSAYIVEYVNDLPHILEIVRLPKTEETVQSQTILDAGMRIFVWDDMLTPYFAHILQAE